MILNDKQPQLWQKFHKAVVTVDSISWENGEVRSMIVTYPKDERWRGQRQLYWNDESKPFSLTWEGEPVFEEVPQHTAT